MLWVKRPSTPGCTFGLSGANVRISADSMAARGADPSLSAVGMTAAYETCMLQVTPILGRKEAAMFWHVVGIILALWASFIFYVSAAEAALTGIF